ncbi:MAG: putative family peptidase [Gemmatimonadetes bacterium]|nr:putative family peptidase [Gemmatimonadota bacterium]
MSSNKFARARIAGYVGIAFLCGLIFASGFDLTHFSWAQSKTAPKPSVSEVKSLAEVGSAFEAIADHVTPAVVSIQNERLAPQRSRQRANPNAPPGFEDLMRQFGGESQQPQESSGSGFIVSKDGYILTNNHVVADADKLTVTLLDRRTFTAKVVGRDPTTDVAVIKIDGAGDLPVVSLGDDASARVGQWVLAIGNPLGLDFTVTAGIVSAKGRGLAGLAQDNYSIQDFIQTDAAINPGNSGGPLVNIRGEVIGINSAIASNTGYYAGYGFAIPVTLARQVMNDLIEFGKVKRAVLGVSIQPVTPADAKGAGLPDIRGAKVSAFTDDDSPARKAGMEIGDIIITAAGTKVETVPSLQRAIRGYKPGQTVEVEVMRFGSKKTFRVKLAEVPDDPAQRVASSDTRGGDGVEPVDARSYDKLGLTVQPVPSAMATQARLSDDARRGLLITDVSVTGPAYRELFARRDIILRVLNPVKKEIMNAHDLDTALSGIKRGEVITLVVYDTAAQSTRVVSIQL